MKCNYCGKEAENRFICPSCGRRTNLRYVPMTGATVYNEYNLLADVPNILMIILAFLMPPFGIFYYFMRVSTYKTTARAYLAASLSGIGVVVLIATILILSLFA